MKKRIISLIVLMVTLLCSFSSFTACSKEHKYTVWFDGGENSKLISGKEMQIVTSPAEIVPPVYELDGWAFDGWDKDLNKITTNTVVKAKWTRWKINFNGNGGRLVDGKESQLVGKVSDIIVPTYVKTGYTLTWDKDISEVKADTTVNAIWTANKYKLTLLDADSKIIEVKYDDKIGELPTVQKQGFRFGFWAVDGSNVKENTVWKWTENKTATAYWLNQGEYLLDLDYNGGSVSEPNPATYRADGETFTVNNPTRYGYDFVCWVTPNDSDATPIKTLTIEKGTQGDKEYQAVWAPKKYTLTLNLRGGASDVESISVTHGTALGELPVPTREGCVFKGWFAGEKQVDKDTVWTFEDISTISAKWEREQYTVKFQLYSVVKGKEVSVRITSGSASDRVVDGSYQLGSELPLFAPIDSGEYAYYGWMLNGKKIAETPTDKQYGIDLTIVEYLDLLYDGTEADLELMESILDTGEIVLVARSRALWTGFY